ncbi:MAG: hypothetical protein LBT43_02710, partial [Prevotella sp.]|nr:hypothetical protein [Prevotella sp.]
YTKIIFKPCTINTTVRRMISGNIYTNIFLSTRQGSPHTYNLKRGCSPQTCNIRLSALRAFLGYLGNKNIRYKSTLYDAKTIEKR